VSPTGAALLVRRRRTTGSPHQHTTATQGSSSHVPLPDGALTSTTLRSPLLRRHANSDFLGSTCSFSVGRPDARSAAARVTWRPHPASSSFWAPGPKRRCCCARATSRPRSRPQAVPSALDKAGVTTIRPRTARPKRKAFASTRAQGQMKLQKMTTSRRHRRARSSRPRFGSCFATRPHTGRSSEPPLWVQWAQGDAAVRGPLDTTTRRVASASSTTPHLQRPRRLRRRPACQSCANLCDRQILAGVAQARFSDAGRFPQSGGCFRRMRRHMIAPLRHPLGPSSVRHLRARGVFVAGVLLWSVSCALFVSLPSRRGCRTQ